VHFQLVGNDPIYRQIVEQVRLAVAAGKLSPGSRLPTVRALAADLGVNANTVSRAYLELEQAGVLLNRPGRGSFVASDGRPPSERSARLQTILGRAVLDALSLGYSVAEVEASFGLGLARWRQESSYAEATQRGHGDLRLAGSHDLVLDLLAARLAREVPPLWLDVTAIGSLDGLIALVRGEAEVAGCHLLDTDSGEYNLPFVRRLMPGRHVVVVQLAGRQQGLIVRRGNPRGIHSLDDLARLDVAFVNRQAGSGTRLLLDYHIDRAGLSRASIRGYERAEMTHLRVAQAVAEGEADAALGIFAAARAFDLDYLPLWQERYDLVIPREHWTSPKVVRLLAVLGDPEFRSIVQEMGGYDAGAMGDIVAEL
jgi:molybdate-binding protein/DNA-binding transcriptional regulator YhcF (GntR family)